jgi:periplasmic nitrate reductase NapD
MHISSLIVDARPQDAAALRDTLSAWEGVDVHAVTDTGRLIVTLDTDTAAQTQALFSRIGAEPGVMSLALVYHQHDIEAELEA